MRILLIPPKTNYPNPGPGVEFGQGMPYLASFLKAAGHEVFGININHIWCHGSAPLTLEKLLRDAIEQYQPHLIGVGGVAPEYIFVRDIIFFSRKIAPDIPIVCGGGIITYDSHFIFSNLRPDFAIIGEGEISIVKLVDYLEKGGDVDSVPSLVHWKNGEVAINDTQYPENLDELPFPDYSPFSFENYLSLNNVANNFVGHTRHNPRVMPLSIGRSCPFKCTFCSHYTTYRTRSIDCAIDEIAYFYEKYQFNILYITDELFSIKTEKTREFCSKLKVLKKELKADIDWGCYLKVNDVDSDLLREMKDSGCIYIGFGFESASNAVLNSMKKGTTAEKISRAIQLTEEAGIGLHANFIFGDVAETPETIGETTAFYNRYCRDLTVYFYYITPYPGSELFQYCLDNNLIADKQEYYETTAHNKGSVNMTSMPDDIFYKLTKPAMNDMFDGKTSVVLSCERTDIESCDQNAPFELRRSFYMIVVVCPHCSKNSDYLYPLRVNTGMRVKPFLHCCTKCHKKLMVDVSQHIPNSKQEEDPYVRFYSQVPYSNYYPLDGTKYAMPSVSTPQLLESYEGYNLISYADVIYAIAQSLGSLDITQLEEDCLIEYQRAGTCFIGKSIEETKRLIDVKVNSFV